MAADVMATETVLAAGQKWHVTWPSGWAAEYLVVDISPLLLDRPGDPCLILVNDSGGVMCEAVAAGTTAEDLERRFKVRFSKPRVSGEEQGEMGSGF